MAPKLAWLDSISLPSPSLQTHTHTHTNHPSQSQISFVYRRLPLMWLNVWRGWIGLPKLKNDYTMICRKDFLYPICCQLGSYHPYLLHDLQATWWLKRFISAKCNTLLVVPVGCLVHNVPLNQEAYSSRFLDLISLTNHVGNYIFNWEWVQLGGVWMFFASNRCLAASSLQCRLFTITATF